MNIKKILLILFLLKSILIHSLEIKSKIIFELKERLSSFFFLNNSEVLEFGNIISIYNINDNKIKMKKKIKIDMIPDIRDFLNQQILFYLYESNNSYPELSIYDLNNDKIIKLSKYFSEEKYDPYLQYYPFYWDYYGKNEKIIYQYSDLSVIKDGEIVNFGIYNRNIVTGENKLIVNNARLLDYNQGLLLYSINDIKNKSYKLFLFDERNNKTIALNDLPKISLDGSQIGSDLRDLKIFKNNYFLARNNNQLSVIESKTGKIHNINIKDNILGFYFKYNLEFDLIGINITYKNGNYGFLVLKVDIIDSLFYSPSVPNLRFRESPDLNGKFIRSLNQGEKLELIEKGKEETINNVKGTWVKVKTEKGEVGWCFDAYLEPYDEVKKSN